MPVKAIQLLLNEQLPEDIRDYSRTYDSGSIKELMTEAANKHPDEYSQIVKNIMDVGRNAAYNTGYTVRLNDFKPVLDRKPIFEQLDNEVANVRATVKDKNKREKLIKQIFEKYTVGLEKLTTAAAKKLGTGNNLYNAIQSGARGNNTQFKAIVTTPGLYTDYKGDTIPLFIKHSYADGLSPAELLSSTFGTRKSFITIKKSTATAGGWGKSLLRPVSTMVVTSDKDLSDNGIDLDTDDDSLYGRVLARDAGNLKKGTVIDRNALNYLKNSKIKSVIVHSPIATISANGVPAQAVGLNIQKKLYSIGEHPGYNAATAISEPVTQAGLSSKHTAGAFQGRRSFSGLNYIMQFTESPEEFKDKAAVAETSGKVEKIYDAPQGGKYIKIGDTESYVLPGFDIFVKPGDKVERGDIISDGLADPEDIVRLRGIGEGRRYFVDRMKQMLDDSGAKTNKRNLELIARGFIDKVRITNPDGMGDFLPDDIVSYNQLEANYSPEEDSKLYKIDDTNAVGKYLQKPVLHYTIGTKLTPKMLDHIKRSNITDAVLLSDKEPSFEPVLVRLREAATKGDRDWLARGTASYQKSNYLESASRGYKSNIRESYNPFTRMSQPDFAEHIYETGKY